MSDSPASRVTITWPLCPESPEALMRRAHRHILATLPAPSWPSLAAKLRVPISVLAHTASLEGLSIPLITGTALQDLTRRWIKPTPTKWGDSSWEDIIRTHGIQIWDTWTAHPGLAEFVTNNWLGSTFGETYHWLLCDVLIERSVPCEPDDLVAHLGSLLRKSAHLACTEGAAAHAQKLTEHLITKIQLLKQPTP